MAKFPFAGVRGMQVHRDNKQSRPTHLGEKERRVELLGGKGKEEPESELLCSKKIKMQTL